MPCLKQKMQPLLRVWMRGCLPFTGSRTMDAMSTVARRSDSKLDNNTAGTLEAGSSMVRSTDANNNLERTKSPRHILLIHREQRPQGSQRTPSESLAHPSLPESAKNLCSLAPTKTLRRITRPATTDRVGPGTPEPFYIARYGG
jgi:hypothetical protein